MGELDNYTFLESSDYVDNGKKVFFLTFGAQVFSGNFLKVVKDISLRSMLGLLYSTVSFNLFRYCLFSKIYF